MYTELLQTCPQFDYNKRLQCSQLLVCRTPRRADYLVCRVIVAGYNEVKIVQGNEF